MKKNIDAVVDLLLSEVIASRTLKDVARSSENNECRGFVVDMQGDVL